MQHTSPIMRILFLSLEFSAKTFSGNGIAAQSQARALADVGQHVLVLAASPLITEVSLGGLDQDRQRKVEHTAAGGSFQLIEVPATHWGRLDSSAPWEELQRGAGNPAVLAQVNAFRPEVAMVVDWSALPAWRTLASALDHHPPYVWLNYRVFSRTEQGEGHVMVSRLEAEAMAGAACTIVLSRSDQAYLKQHVRRPGDPQSTVHVLLCALRGDMKRIPLLPARTLHTQPHTTTTTDTRHPDRAHHLSDPQPPASNTAGTSGGHASQQAATQGMSHPVTGQQSEGTPVSSGPQQRRYLTCVVRLAPEKEPLKFVELVQGLHRRGTLDRLGLTPLMVASTQDEYAQRVKTAFRTALPHGVVLEQFMGPQQLAEVYAATRLNIHPATYDAFGMTIVEAASQECPSVVHDGNGAVGATDLLHAGDDEVILVDLKQETDKVVEAVEAVLLDDARLQLVGQRAAFKARSWDEEAHARQLMEWVVSSMGRTSSIVGNDEL